MKITKSTAITVAVFGLLSLSERDASARDIAFGNSFTLAGGTYLKLGFEKVAGKSYDICVIPSSGNPNMYTHYTTWATTSSYQYRSVNGAGLNDCVTLTNVVSGGDYYFSIYASGGSATFTFFVYEY